MRHGSLFSGIGGFDLAAWWLGWQNVFHVEIDPFCRHVLKTHFPFASQYNDIKKFKGGSYHGTIDIISGGFPCQPFSIAGQRRGREDDRYLWPEMLRVINEIRPTWVVGENVAGILSMVQPGMPVDLAMQARLSKEDQEIITEHEYLIETICQDIERIGYSVQPFLIPACGASAPHLRNRVWFVAHTESNDGGRIIGTVGEKSEKAQKIIWPGFDGETGNLNSGRTNTNSHRERLERTTGKIILSGQYGQPAWTDPIPTWDQWPIESPVCRRDDGVSQTLAGISFSKWRKESIRSFGNAIVPQLAYQIFHAIDSIHNQRNEYEPVL